MEFEGVIRGRRSIRRFKPDAVPHEIVRELLDEARWSPSWANTQAWNIYVVAGETLERLKGAGKAPDQRETPAGPDFGMPSEWPPHLAARTKQLFDLRAAFAPEPGRIGPAEFFGAHCLLLFAIERGLAIDYALFDSGLLVQSVCLAAHSKGLGTCIMAMAVRDPDSLRELLPQSADKQFVIGVALGYPDGEAQINRFERQRAQLEEVVTWAE
ncbi:MAG: nitroreductase [Thermoleophilia bacterium]